MQLNKVAEIGIENNIISREEADLLVLAEKLRLETINVDDFDFNALAAQYEIHSKMDEVA
ncbi:acyl-CoA dehydrogenase [Vibrio nigripulchritudo ATCC 27043]|nr:acyl-CoA dehydrogenase [Vibrio nigripulchritudo ATCC 27043]